MDSAAPVVLECSGLRKSFGDRLAVTEVGFRIAAGEVYGLLGPNGAGKTTTIRMICGLLLPDAGSIKIAGRDAIGSLAVKRFIGYVPQDVALYPDLTARENLEFLGRLHGLNGKLLAERVEEALTVTDLGDRRNDRLDSYSGGMRRRLNIAAGLLNHPKLLILDEPTVGVDPQSRHAILERVQEFGRGGMAVVYTTHYMEEAERVCTRVGIIDRGRLVAEGTRRELVARLGAQDRIELSANGDAQKLAEVSRAVPGVTSAAVADHTVQLIAADGRRLLPVLLEAAEAAHVSVSSVDVIEPDLEAVFLHLTGTALRE
jgi:ABC-2 type transport system ATP-binding protein